MLAIVDYGAGNLTSVARALEHIGASCVITDKPEELAQADGVIFPGVGSAPQAMTQLRKQGLDKALVRAVDYAQPLLGICLGCQILLESSEEGPIATLGLLSGTCKRFPDDLKQEDGSVAPIPHMGWNGIKCCKESAILRGIPENAEFYFVHSYYVEPEPDLVIARTGYGWEFCSIYGRDGLWAVQFHAEKSGKAGLKLLENFQRYCSGKAHAV